MGGIEVITPNAYTTDGFQPAISRQDSSTTHLNREVFKELCCFLTT